MTGKELDRSVHHELRTLSKENAEGVAQHLVMVARLIADEDLEGALAHAETAARRAGRVPSAREALAFVHYRRQEWAQALTEYRTVRRLSGSNHVLPYLVDCERAMGRFDRALEMATGPEAQALTPEDQVEVTIVLAGIRRDQGRPDLGVAQLRQPAQRTRPSDPWAARLWYAYADLLEAAGDRDEAYTWFAKANAADDDGMTDASERLELLDGVVLVDLDDSSGDEDDSLGDASAGPSQPERRAPEFGGADGR